MQSHWRVFTNANTPEKALRLLNRLQGRLGREPSRVQAQPYHKGGHVVTFMLTHDSAEWSDTVLDVLACAQSVGRIWTLHPPIQHEVDLVTTEAPVAGVEMIQCTCARGRESGAA